MHDQGHSDEGLEAMSSGQTMVRLLVAVEQDPYNLKPIRTFGPFYSRRAVNEWIKKKLEKDGTREFKIMLVRTPK